MPAFQDHVEAEWQFDVDDLKQVETWIRDLPASIAVAITMAEPDEHLDTYFDTDDWRVYRSGYALRLRRSQNNTELTLKSLTPHEDGFAHRREVTQQLPNADVDELDQVLGPVGERIAAIRGHKHTSPLFSVITRRQRFRLWREGREVGELALDNATFVGSSFEEQKHLLRVEVETSVENFERLRPFVDEISSACCLRPASGSKFATGVRIMELNPPADTEVGATTFDRESTIADLAFAMLRRQLVEMTGHEPGTRLGDDPEELHDMRVAVRRTRAALALFSRFLDPELESLRDEFRWVARALGEVRDLDVQLAEIQGWKAELDPRDAIALDGLISELNRRRDAVRLQMLAVLDSERYEQLVARFADLLRIGPASAGSELAIDIAPELVLKRYRKFRRMADRIKNSSPDADLHAVRIEGKRLRYALEFVSPLYGKVVQEFIRQLVTVQDVLGRHQDSIIAIDHLRDLSVDATAALPSSTVFSMGRVAERYATAATESRSQFSKVYRRFDGKRAERLEREMRRRSKPRQAHRLEVSQGNEAAAGESLNR